MKQKFNVIYIDFPWSYNDVNTGGSLKSGAKWVYGAKNKYQSGTMSLLDIRMVVHELSEVMARNCVVFMWSTTPLDQEANEVVQLFKVYGVEYKGKLYWKKVRKKMGMGRYFRNEVEELRFLVKHVKPFGIHAKNIFYLPALEHSHKPEEFYDILEQVGWIVFGKNANFLELFATKKREGWTQLGFEIDGKDMRKALQDLKNNVN